MNVAESWAGCLKGLLNVTRSQTSQTPCMGLHSVATTTPTGLETHTHTHSQLAKHTHLLPRVGYKSSVITFHTHTLSSYRDAAYTHTHTHTVILPRCSLHTVLLPRHSLHTHTHCTPPAIPPTHTLPSPPLPRVTHARHQNARSTKHSTGEGGGP